MDAIAILEVIKTIGGALGTLLTVSAVVTLLVKPVREKFTKWVRKTSDSDDITDKIDNLTGLVEKSIKQNEELQTEMHKQSDALQASLRNSILNLYYKCMARESITLFERQNLLQLYENYQNLKGNSFIHDCVEQLLALPCKD